MCTTSVLRALWPVHPASWPRGELFSDWPPTTNYSAFRKYSYPLTYSTFCCVTDYFYSHPSTYNNSLLLSWKHVFLKFLHVYWKWNKYLHPFAMTLQIELRCIQFNLIIFEMSLQLDWSTPGPLTKLSKWARRTLVREVTKNTVTSLTELQSSLAEKGEPARRTTI